MTKRGVPALAIALAAVLAFCGQAMAQRGSLSVTQANKLARQLAQDQIRNRDIVSFHVLGPRRISANELVYAYDDRSAGNVYCTADLLVTRTVTRRVTRIRARFRGQQCARIPADALAVEAATRAAQRSLRGTALATSDAIDRLNASLKRCRNLEVPRNRRTAVGAIVDIATVEALEGPNDQQLGAFAFALGRVQPASALIQHGAAGWIDYLDVIRSLPAIPDPCATLQRWAQADWAASAAPIDLAAYDRLNARAEVDQRAITRAARYLARVGVFPRTVVAFTPQGLLLRLAPKAAKAAAATLHKPALLNAGFAGSGESR